MAMLAGMALPRIVLLAGAGCTGTIFMKGKMSDVLAELKQVLKKAEKTGGDLAEPVEENIARQIERITNEVLEIKSSQVTVFNGSSGLDITIYLPTVAAVGVVGYGYMWWKGISISDMMYVTKRNMEKAVSNLTSHLGQVTVALESAKKHLTQRIQGVDDQVKLQIELSKKTGEQIDNVHKELSQVGCSVADIQSLVYALEDKTEVLEKKQEQLQQPESSNPRMLAFQDDLFLTGLKGLVDEMDNNKPRHMSRTISSRG